MTRRKDMPQYHRVLRSRRSSAIAWMVSRLSLCYFLTTHLVRSLAAASLFFCSNIIFFCLQCTIVWSRILKIISRFISSHSRCLLAITVFFLTKSSKMEFCSSWSSSKLYIKFFCFTFIRDAFKTSFGSDLTFTLRDLISPLMLG